MCSVHRNRRTNDNNNKGTDRKKNRKKRVVQIHVLYLIF